MADGTPTRMVTVGLNQTINTEEIKAAIISAIKEGFASTFSQTVNNVTSKGSASALRNSNAEAATASAFAFRDKEIEKRITFHAKTQEANDAYRKRMAENRISDELQHEQKKQLENLRSKNRIEESSFAKFKSLDRDALNILKRTDKKAYFSELKERYASDPEKLAQVTSTEKKWLDAIEKNTYETRKNTQVNQILGAASGILGGRFVSNMFATSGQMGMIMGRNPITTGYQYGSMVENMLNTKQQYVTNAMSDLGNVVQMGGMMSRNPYVMAASTVANFALQGGASYLKYQTKQKAQQSNYAITNAINKEVLRSTNAPVTEALTGQFAGMTKGQKTGLFPLYSAMAQAYQEVNPVGTKMYDLKNMANMAQLYQWSPQQAAPFAGIMAQFGRFGSDIDSTDIFQYAQAYGRNPMDVAQGTLNAVKFGLTGDRAKEAGAIYSQLSPQMQAQQTAAYTGSYTNEYQQRLMFRAVTHGKGNYDLYLQGKDPYTLALRAKAEKEMAQGGRHNLTGDVWSFESPGFELRNYGLPPEKRDVDKSLTPEPTKTENMFNQATWNQLTENAITVAKAFEILGLSIKKITKDINVNDNRDIFKTRRLSLANGIDSYFGK